MLRTSAGRTFAAYPISTSQTSPLLGFVMTGLLGVIHGENSVPSRDKFFVGDRTGIGLRNARQFEQHRVLLASR